MTSWPRSVIRRAVRGVRRRLVLGDVVMHGPLRPVVALTFDDGPTVEHTPAILDILRARNARATFFMLGMFLEKNPDIGRRVLAEQEIGCHSHAHGRTLTEDIDTFTHDTQQALEVFDRVLGVRPRYYRFPWGRHGRIAPRDVERQFGMHCIHWSGAGGDDQGTTDGIVERMSNALEPGAILLLHDGTGPGSVYPGSRERTVHALPRILDAIESAGLRSVTLTELLDDARFR